ncbi:MAG TPA: peptidase M4 [Bacilli bacterium]|uniref:PepSY domain-containing protein n=1 Tax=Amphibacillus indicireducens TaxID=1076330 RepID=A0ABP7W485_9BACI|nr:peptidase M4 [Bacilli bacterium]
MNWKKALGTLGVGIAIGYFIKAKVSDMPIQAERALKIAKDKFKEGGAVSGSWIYMKSEAITLHGLEYLVYRGGITRTIDGENKQYEFYVDAYTGTIISTEETKSMI